MNDRIQVLDCTLRDGGFVNNWLFGNHCINDIISRLDQAKIDIIEVGYLRDYVQYNINSTEFPSTNDIRDTLYKSSFNSMIVAIIDYGNCSIDNIGTKNQSPIDGIRLTFKKNDIDEALEFAKKIKEKGYYLFLQPVAITGYDSKSVIDLIEKINPINPYAISMVDTYGFMQKRELLKYFYLFDSNLLSSIKLGYHSHNNYQLSYSNSIELISQPTKRNLIIDSSVFGMGKGAGNLNTELIAAFINENCDGEYGINEILEIIDIYLEREREHNYWGYNLKYYIAAINDCHHQYVEFLLKKKCFTMDSINTILSRIESEKKISFDEEYITELIGSYCSKDIAESDSISIFKSIINNRPILIVAPGNNIIVQADLINEYIANNKPYVVCINHNLKQCKPNAIFVGNSIRYSQLENELYPLEEKEPIIIISSNVSPGRIEPKLVFNYMIPSEAAGQQNSTLQFLGILIRLGVKRVAIAGFDGYSEDNNYSRIDMQLNELPKTHNEYVKKALYAIRNEINIDFVTDSLYKED